MYRANHQGKLTAASLGVLALATTLAISIPATAQTPAEAAAMNMHLALDTCMRHHRRSDDLPDALMSAGFALSPGMDEGTFEFTAPGVFGIIRAGGAAGGYCSIQSSMVPIAQAEGIGAAVGERYWPGKVVPGSPAGNANTPPEPCEGYTIWETRPIITVSYAQAGNSGECVNDGTSAIIISM
jgi:hypothetical protein